VILSNESLDPLSLEPQADSPDPFPASWVVVRSAVRGPELVLQVFGEADLTSAGQLRTDLLAELGAAPAGTFTLSLDLAGLGFCDLAGLDALHALLSVARSQHVRVQLSGMSPQLSWLHRNFPDRTARRRSRRTWAFGSAVPVRHLRPVCSVAEPASDMISSGETGPRGVQ